jgi:hypothetical protein
MKTLEEVCALEKVSEAIKDEVLGLGGGQRMETLTWLSESKGSSKRGVRKGFVEGGGRIYSSGGARSGK